MGPALATRSTQIVAGYASLAGAADVHNIHHSNGIFPGTSSSMAGIEKCPHASAAREAARMARDLEAAAKKKKKEKADAKHAAAAAAAAASSSKAAAAGCPFHKAAEPSLTQKAETTSPSGFHYENFYDAELEKKHKDKSYRYFNNINRLANKFPVAHTANVKEEVEVWCANDYLGMGNNPIVLETTQ
jgi:5-aminolevulinate synthase